MRLLVALALVVAMTIACGGGAADPIRVAPAVTSAPTSDPAKPSPTGGYYEGY